MSADAAGADTPAKPRRKRRWWVRLIRAGLLLLLLLVLVLSGALWWAYTKRVVLLNNAISDAGPLRTTVGGLEVTRSGGLEVRDLVFTDRTTGAVVARVPHVSGQANLAKLPPEQITNLTLRAPEIIVSAAMIDTWRKAAAVAETVTGSAAPPIPYGIRFDKVNVEDAKLRFVAEDGATADVTLNYHGEGLNVQDTGISTGTQELTIENVSVKAADGTEAPFELSKVSVKGRVEDGMVDIEKLELDKPGFHITPELLAMFGMKASPTAPAAAVLPTLPAPLPGIMPIDPTPSPGSIRGFRIQDIKLNEVLVSARGFAENNPTGLQLPNIHALVSYEARDVEWRPGSIPQVASQKMELRDVRIETPNDTGHVRLDSASLVFDADDSRAHWTIDSLALSKPDLRWTSQLRSLIMAQARGTNTPAPTPDPPHPPAPPPSFLPPGIASISLKQGSISGAAVSITDAEVMPFELHTKGALMLANLTLDAKGLQSQSYQTLEVTETRLVFPTPAGQPEKKPWLELPRGELVVQPDEWNQHARLARLELDKPLVRIRDGNTPWVASQSPPPAGTSSTPVPAPEPQKPETRNPKPETAAPPWWQRINCGQLTLNQGFADLVLDLPKPVAMQAGVNISTQRREDGGSQHTVRIAEFTARLPTISEMPFPIAQARLLEGVVRLPEMWTQKRIDQLHLTGASVDFGEAIMKLFEAEKKEQEPAVVTPEPAAPAPLAEPQPEKIVLTGPPEAHWSVGSMKVEQSSVTVSNLVPGLPAVKFGVSFDVQDTPLQAEDLASHVAEQRVELHNLKIPSPNGTARYVAELDSIFVNFSLAGLMRKEIERIEIVSPTLFVGEDLFWYVDFYRKYAERGTDPAAPGPNVAAVDDELEFELGKVVAEAEPPASQAAWSVKRLQVHSGKLLLAPKGVPLRGGFYTPFPFHIDTEVKRGTLNAEMQIPQDTYELPNLDLQLVGLRGQVQFNLPIRQRDNNLVETFEVDSIRYKEMKTGKGTLSVTYDSAGIYAQFWVEAYEGDLNGQVNVYTDDSFHWDGWIGGKNVQMENLTRILSPTYFLMKGKVEATLVAQGSKDELYQADATFKNLTPGKFNVTAVNDIIKDLPKEWDPLKAQVTKILLETMRDFAYDRAEMKARFYGREGNGRLSFIGPTGSRNFDINVYDHRWTTDKKPVERGGGTVSLETSVTKQPDEKKSE